MNGVHLVVFRLDEQRYALPLAVVERVVRAAEVTSLPNAPRMVAGAIDIAGRVLPVLNIRRKFGLAEREISPDDQFLIAQLAQRTVVLLVDKAESVIEPAASDIVGAAEITPALGHIQGVVKCTNGLILIHDLEKFLSLDEARILDAAMMPTAPHENE